MNTNTTSSNQSSSNNIHTITMNDQQLLFIQKCIKAALQNNLVQEEQDELDNPVGDFLDSMIEDTITNKDQQKYDVVSFID